MQCEAQQLLPYAGFCWQAVARCENDLGHPNGEISALIRGGRLFLQAERKGASVGCQNAGGENVQVCLTILASLCSTAAHLCSVAPSR